MATIERKSSIRKAPVADVVDALTNQPLVEGQSSHGSDSTELPTRAAARGSKESGGVPRPGPGRPRSKRRMEPFSSKIEIGLRDELDGYLAQREMTVVDFLDQAIRAQLNR
ncbi:hypothetical protein ACQCSX_21215 (plasmid) [Pseudarthrobacter sp. P1]|uniref:hypothetical protein n=1 Tax=Pseudarthrobacter sp. P1 TaxID=3418418 RepID=UPI003CEEAFDB